MNSIDTNVRNNTDYLEKKFILYNVISMCFGIFFARCNIKGVIYPFGQAYFICMLSYTMYYKSAFIGTCIGWLTCFNSLPVVPIVSTSLTYLSVILAQRKYKFDLVHFLKVAFIFFTLICILIFRTKYNYYLMIGLCEGFVSIGNLFVMDKSANVLFIRRKKNALTDDEAVCIVFCLCSFVIAFSNISVATIEFGMVIAGFITMLFAYLFGSLVGSACGLIMGLCVSLGGGSIFVMGSMGVCGFACGFFKKYGRSISVFVYCIANSILTIYINGSAFKILPIQNSLLSGAMLIFIPISFMDWIKKVLCNTLSKSNEEKYYYEKCNTLARDKIRNMANLFTNMSELFMARGILDKSKEESMTTIVEGVCDKVCKNCENYVKCWEENFFNTYARFEENVVLCKKHGHINKTLCKNGLTVEKAIQNQLDIIANKEKSEKKIRESKALLSKQLTGLAGVLKNLDSEIKSNVIFEKEIERNIKEELIARSIIVYDVCVMNVASSLTCEITVNGCGGTRICKSKIEPIVSKYCNKAMKLEKNLCNYSSRQKCTLTFKQVKPLKVVSCVSQYSKEDVCGDSFNVTYINDNKYMLLLSDGMGSGKRAKEESSACVSLVEDFLRAGFDSSVVFSTVNKLLMIKNKEDIFTTVDMCMIDLTRQKAEFTKVGAVPSFILKKDKGVVIVHGNSLPLGILDDVEPKNFIKDIEQGDILIMFTDGVFDRLGGMENIQSMDETLFSIVGNLDNPKEISNKILTYAKNTGGEKDDMSVLVSVFRKS